MLYPYNLVIKSIAINDTVFRGVIGAYEVDSKDELKGRIIIKGKVLAVSGDISSFLLSNSFPFNIFSNDKHCFKIM